jgi:MATE family multidrug resistance protein
MLGRFTPTLPDIRALLHLALPMVAAQVGLMSLGVVDVIVVGHVSAHALAGVSLGNLYVFGLAVSGMATLWALDPIVSQAMGAKDMDGVALGIQRGLLLSVAIGLTLTLLCLPAAAIFRLLREPAEVIPSAAGFVWISAFGMVPLLLFSTLRQSLQAMKLTRTLVLTILLGNAVNLFFNWVFVFGHLGAKPGGAEGSALSSVLGRWIMLATLLFFSRHRLRPFLRPWRRDSFLREPLLRTIRIGLPIGVQASIEFTTFAAISIMAGWFGEIAIGGHQVAINIASLTFMVPAGVSGAASVLVGHAIGEGDLPHARRVAASALGVGAGFMALSALTLRALPEVFARLYTNVPGVIALAAVLLPIAGVFQVFDGIQVVASGILRGAGDTRAAMISNLLGFYLVGMPVSLWCGFGLHMGVVGLWWGFVAGLTAVAAFLVFRVRVTLGREVTRVRIDDQATLTPH